MDTSEQYINMCRKATELQEMWEPKEGDWFYRKVRWIEHVVTIGRFSMQEFNHQQQYDPALSREIKKQSTEIWLPRIDQYLDLLGKDYPPHERFIMTIKDRSKVEQELLAELYKKNYCKIWNGEEWI